MNGIELDRRLREILMSATRETAVSSALAIHKLGFDGMVAIKLVTDVVLAREMQQKSSHSTKPRHRSRKRTT